MSYNKYLLKYKGKHQDVFAANWQIEKKTEIFPRNK